MSTREKLARDLEETDLRMRALVDDLSEAQLAVPYERGINPPIWEMGHAAFFYECFLLREIAGREPRMPGYDEVWDSFEIMHKHRWTPGVVPDGVATRDYYERVIDEARERLDGGGLDAKEEYLYRYVIAHQQMHIESLIWARQTLAYQAPPPGEPGRPAPVVDSGVSGDAAVPGGEYFIGVPGWTETAADAEFSFDNERPGFRAEVAPFQISKTLVSNGEFLEFVQDGGYRNDALWSFGGKCWLVEGGEERCKPAYWREGDGGGWQLRRFDQWFDLPLDSPALHLSYWEAEAFCKWAGRRLPTEAEWEAAARGTAARKFPWGGEIDRALVDMDGTLFATAPANAFPDGVSEAGCLQMLGTAWEWTGSQFLPYDGFKIDMYQYMSVLQFGDHKVTKGGSCATCSSLIRNTYRQAYFPGRTDVFTGFRTCAR